MEHTETDFTTFIQLHHTIPLDLRVTINAKGITDDDLPRFGDALQQTDVVLSLDNLTGLLLPLEFQVYLSTARTLRSLYLYSSRSIPMEQSSPVVQQILQAATSLTSLKLFSVAVNLSFFVNQQNLTDLQLLECTISDTNSIATAGELYTSNLPRHLERLSASIDTPTLQLILHLLPEMLYTVRAIEFSPDYCTMKEIFVGPPGARRGENIYPTTFWKEPIIYILSQMSDCVDLRLSSCDSQLFNLLYIAKFLHKLNGVPNNIRSLNVTWLDNRFMRFYYFASDKSKIVKAVKESSLLSIEVVTCGEPVPVPVHRLSIYGDRRNWGQPEQTIFDAEEASAIQSTLNRNSKLRSITNQFIPENPRSLFPHLLAQASQSGHPVHIGLKFRAIRSMAGIIAKTTNPNESRKRKSRDL